MVPFQLTENLSDNSNSIKLPTSISSLMTSTLIFKVKNTWNILKTTCSGMFSIEMPIISLKNTNSNCLFIQSQTANNKWPRFGSQLTVGSMGTKKYKKDILHDLWGTYNLEKTSFISTKFAIFSPFMAKAKQPHTKISVYNVYTHVKI